MRGGGEGGRGSAVVVVVGALAVLFAVVGGEECGSDADEVGAFFDGDLEVAGHAHGEDVEALLADASASDVGEDLPEACEEWSGVFGVFGVGGDGHEAADVEVAGEVDLLAEMGCGGDGAAVFGVLAGGVDLDEDVDVGVAFHRPALHLFDEAEGVDGVDEPEVWECARDLVALEVADHVPADGSEGAAFWWLAGGGVAGVGAELGAMGGGDALHGAVAVDHLVGDGGALDELLDARLAEVLVAEFHETPDVVHLGVLGDGDDEDARGRSAGTLGGGPGPVHDLAVSRFEGVHSRHPCLGSRGGVRRSGEEVAGPRAADCGNDSRRVGGPSRRRRSRGLAGSTAAAAKPTCRAEGGAREVKRGRL